MPICIKDKQKLVDIWKVIAWLDVKRWCNESNYNFINFFRNDLTNSEKILTHWLCYITDRQMPFEVVWEKGGYVFSELVHAYSSDNCSSKELLNKYYEGYSNDQKKRRYRFKSTGNTVFASRYITDDYQNILQTLQVLENYDRNIVKYILEIIRKYQTKQDLLIRIACGLCILTYQLGRGKKANPEKATQIINGGNKFEQTYTTFRANSTDKKKRLWCSIRDYKKGLYNTIFNEAIREVAGNQAEGLIILWNNLPMNQIELPGDVWNNSPLFKDNLFASVLDMSSISKSWSMPRIIRELYKGFQTEDTILFYPEQFDITFDFVPRMCSKKLCDVCPFSQNGVEQICAPNSDKLCPVALVSCGYLSKCVGENTTCIIREGSGRGICKTRPR